MTTNGRFLLKIGVVIFLATVLVFFGFQKSKDYLQGPKIIISSPKNGATVADEFSEIKGSAKNISRIFVNNRQIFTDKNGDFKDGLLLTKGYNIIEVVGQDKFGREVKERRELVLK